MDLLFATGNPKKSEELKALLSLHDYNVLDLNDLHIDAEIEESGKTLHENANIKATFLCDYTQKTALAEDSGLEVDALFGEPGVYSARYAGIPKNDSHNTQKLLQNLQNIENRAAQFRTVIALVSQKGTFSFEGIIRGKIIDTPRGINGFGYDPVFVPDGYDQTFAELSSDIKNKISHRANAVQKLITFLTTNKHLL
jgi:XTP/dITP diphosphohydrolase